MNKDLLKYSATFGGGLAIGFGVGYVVAQKRLKKKYADLADTEIAEMRDHYQEKLDRAQKEGEFSTPESAVRKLIGDDAVVTDEDDIAEAIADGDISVTDEDFEVDEEQRHRMDRFVEKLDYGKVEEEVAVTIERKVRRGNVFDDTEEPAEGELQEVPAPVIDTSKPYVISMEDFIDAHSDEWEHHDKVSISYYQKDNELVDERDMIIPDKEKIIGIANLKRFGELSGDPHMLYIRNEKLRADYEVALEEGSYKEMILGAVEAEERPRNRKFRQDD